MRCSAASLVRLQETVLHTFKGPDAAPDQQAQPTNNDANVGLLSTNQNANAASNSAHQAQHDICFSGAGEREGGEAQANDKGLGERKVGGTQGDTKDNPRDPVSKNVQEQSLTVTASDRQQADSATNSGNTVSKSGPSGNSGAPVGGLLDRKKSVATTLDRTKSNIAMVDRGNKKKASSPAQPYSSGAAAGHGAPGIPKKNTGSINATGNKITDTSTSTSTKTMAEEHHQEKSLGAEPPEVPAESIEAIDLPEHVLTEDNCTFWVRQESWSYLAATIAPVCSRSRLAEEKRSLRACRPRQTFLAVVHQGCSRSLGVTGPTAKSSWREGS